MENKGFMKISPKTKFILLNVAAALAIFIIIIAIVLSFLKSYTNHGHFISVPSFYGLSTDEATNVATKNNLRILVIDSLYDEESKPGTIVEQYPASGSQVKDMRLIHLTINAQNPEKVSFPNLQHAAFRQTLQTLESCGFRVGNIEYVPYDFKNLVIGFKHNNQYIEAGSSLPKGSVINIVLGMGEEGEDLEVFIPRLVGKKITDAVSTAKIGYLNIDKIIPDATVKTKADSLSAAVYQQTPAYQEQGKITAGSYITLYITLQKKKLTSAIDSLAAKN